MGCILSMYQRGTTVFGKSMHAAKVPVSAIGIGTCKTMQALPRRLFNSVDELRGAVRSKEARLLGANSNVSLQAHGQNGWHSGLAGLGRCQCQEVLYHCYSTAYCIVSRI